jgi:hypothetical protein
MKEAVKLMKLSEKHIEIITRTAVQAALQHLEIEKQKKAKQMYDNRLRNVKLLLKNYRSFVKHSEDIKLEIKELDKKLELDDLGTDEFAIESIKKSKKRTLAMVKFINKMIKVYETICEQSGNPEELRKYETIYHLYISDIKKSAEEISEIHFLTKKSVYNNVNKACEDLTVLVFGVDGIKFN